MPDDLRELITVEQFTRLLVMLAIAGPLAGLAIGAVLSGKGGGASQGAKRGLAFGLIAPAVLALWFVYNAITAKLGLDRIVNVLANLVLFMVIGLVVGLVLGRRSRATELSTGSPLEAPSAES
jgi:hypothetical protein